MGVWLQAHATVRGNADTRKGEISQVTANKRCTPYQILGTCTGDMVEVVGNVHASNNDPHDKDCSVKCEKSTEMPPLEVRFGPGHGFA